MACFFALTWCKIHQTSDVFFRIYPEIYGISSLLFAHDFTPMPSSIRNSLIWIFEAFESDSTYIAKRMFGSDAAYIDGQLCLVAADRDPPWNGLLVCTSQERHAALIDEMPTLKPHPVLGKWLYVPQDDPAFETIAERMTALVLARDPRVGVEPKPRRRGGKSTPSKG